MTDAQLIQDCKKYLPKAQEALYRKYYGYAMGIALRYAPSREEATETVNDAFMKVFGGLDKFDASREFKPWLGQIVVHTAISQFRRAQKHLYHADVETVQQHALDEQALGKLAVEEIMELLRQLPHIQKVIFSLYEIEGYAHKEIADMLDMSEGTSRSHLSRAKARLQQLMHDYYKYERA